MVGAGTIHPWWGERLLSFQAAAPSLLGTCPLSARQPRLESTTSAIFRCGPKGSLLRVPSAPFHSPPIHPLLCPLVSLPHPPHCLKIRGSSLRQEDKVLTSPCIFIHALVQKAFFKTYLQPISRDLTVLVPFPKYRVGGRGRSAHGALRNSRLLTPHTSEGGNVPRPPCSPRLRALQLPPVWHSCSGS